MTAVLAMGGLVAVFLALDAARWGARKVAGAVTQGAQKIAPAAAGGGNSAGADW